MTRLNQRLIAVVFVLLGCGGSSPNPEPSEHVMKFIVRPDEQGNWYVQGGEGHPDPDHMPIGGQPSVSVVGDRLALNFGRVFTHAVNIQVTSDDDFGKAGIHAYCNLGLAGSMCDIMHRFEHITPAQVLERGPRGAGNFWITVTMADVPR